MDAVETGADAETLGAQVGRGADARRAVGEAAGLGLGGGDEVAQRLEAVAGETTVTLGELPSEATAAKSRAVS